MIRIAICDSDEKNRNHIKKCLLEYDIRADYDLDVSCYSSCENLFNEYLSFKSYDFLIVDISKKKRDDSKMSGVELGKKIRNIFLEKDVAIAFMLHNDSCPIDAIKAKPFDFLVKPIDYFSIACCFDEYLKIHNRNYSSFKFIKDRVENTIFTSRIRYLHSIGKKVVIHTLNEDVEFYGQLSEIMQQQCFANFILIHKSFLINPIFVERYTNKKVYIYGKSIDELPISKNRQNEAKENLAKI